jgi:hypothetical protein
MQTYTWPQIQTTMGYAYLHHRLAQGLEKNLNRVEGKSLNHFHLSQHPIVDCDILHLDGVEKYGVHLYGVHLYGVHLFGNLYPL